MALRLRHRRPRLDPVPSSPAESLHGVRRRRPTAARHRRPGDSERSEVSEAAVADTIFSANSSRAAETRVMTAS